MTYLSVLKHRQIISITTVWRTLRTKITFRPRYCDIGQGLKTNLSTKLSNKKPVEIVQCKIRTCKSFCSKTHAKLLRMEVLLAVHSYLCSDLKINTFYIHKTLVYILFSVLDLVYDDT